MKAIRRSIKGEKEKEANKPHRLSITPKSAIAILPPKKVIKALYDYAPQSQQELPFNKGDFFHVISREDDPDWYEACNPLIPSARGLVPVSYFDVLAKNERESAGSGSGSGSGSDLKSLDPSQPRWSTMGKSSGAMVYGIVQYDFQAERPDELDARAGEAIIVIAQSNPEWFVAKPIGRLGGPGLIPVSFIELRDMQTGQAVTDPLEAVRRAGVPKVEEWKKMTAEYKNSSISLGKIDSAPMASQADKTASQPPTNNGNYFHQRNASKSTLHMSQSLPVPVAASIPRYCFDNDKYWYVIEAKMADGRCWELSRYYHDFYDFQIALLTQFEDEAGSHDRPRTLPYMPGPVTHVTDAISNGRRQNLDEYIKRLLSMPAYISRCQLVRQLFGPRPGDFEIDPSAFGEDARYSAESHHSSAQSIGAVGAGHERSASHQSLQPAADRRGPPPPNGNPPSNPPPMNRQASSLTQVSTNSSGAMKVKVFFQDDLIAIRIPGDITLPQLKEKLMDRLKIRDEILVQYKDEQSGTYAELMSDNDLDQAIHRNAKLTLYVGIA